MPAALPNIFTYTDFRVFRGDFYKVRARSSGWFADVTKGRLNLTGSQLLSLTRLLQLKANEIDYFEALVNIQFFPVSQ